MWKNKGSAQHQHAAAAKFRLQNVMRDMFAPLLPEPQNLYDMHRRLNGKKWHAAEFSFRPVLVLRWQTDDREIVSISQTGAKAHNRVSRINYFKWIPPTDKIKAQL
jgi:hypothetical protein